MLASTIKLLRAALETDVSIGTAERQRLLILLRTSASADKPEATADRVARIIRRREAAQRLSCSLRTVDKLAASGVLQKHKLPGRVRAAGFLESDLNALIDRKETA